MNGTRPRTRRRLLLLVEVLTPAAYPLGDGLVAGTLLLRWKGDEAGARASETGRDVGMFGC